MLILSRRYTERVFLGENIVFTYNDRQGDQLFVTFEVGDTVTQTYGFIEDERDIAPGISVAFLSAQGRQARFGFIADDSVKILREELADRIEEGIA